MRRRQIGYGGKELELSERAIGLGTILHTIGWDGMR